MCVSVWYIMFSVHGVTAPSCVCCLVDHKSCVHWSSAKLRTRRAKHYGTKSDTCMFGYLLRPFAINFIELPS